MAFTIVNILERALIGKILFVAGPPAFKEYGTMNPGTGYVRNHENSNKNLC